MRMRLPPVDVYRRPFVEPLGHLVLNAALADNVLLELCAVINAGGQDPARFAYEEAASFLRNWDVRAKTFVEGTIAKIGDGDMRRDAEDAVARFSIAREDRHRAIHDAVEVGIFEDEGRYRTAVLRTRYLRTGHRELNEIGPEDVAELAYRFHDIAKDLEALEYRLMRD